jgi:hypothetical protein
MYVFECAYLTIIKYAYICIHKQTCHTAKSNHHALQSGLILNVARILCHDTKYKYKSIYLAS